MNVVFRFLLFIGFLFFCNFAKAQNTFIRDNSVFPWNVEATVACREAERGGFLVPGARVLDFKRDYLAVGDGVSDDYSSFKNLANSGLANNTTATLVIFPRAVYKINRYKVTCPSGVSSCRTKYGIPGNNNSDIRYSNLENVRFLGCGSVIDVKGDFNRSQDLLTGLVNGKEVYTSYSDSISPFRMNNSVDFSIEDFVLNGNVDKMQREDVSEGPDNGVFTNGCSRYKISNVEANFFGSDGFYIGQGKGTNKVADREVLLDNIKASNNGRQGITILQARNLSLINSRFTDIGRTNSINYLPYGPSCGIDVEPNTVPGILEGTPIDVQTSNILIDNVSTWNSLGCEFKAQTGADLCSNNLPCPSLIGRVEIRNSNFSEAEDTFATRANSLLAPSFLMSVNDGIVSNSTINLAYGQVFTFWGPARNLRKNVKTTLVGNTIFGNSVLPLIQDGATIRNHQLLIEGNRILLRQDTDTQGIDLRNNQARFIRNEIFFYPLTSSRSSNVALDVQESTRNSYYLFPRTANYLPVEITYGVNSIVANENYYNGNYLIRPSNTRISGEATNVPDPLRPTTTTTSHSSTTSTIVTTSTTTTITPTTITTVSNLPVPETRFRILTPRGTSNIGKPYFSWNRKEGARNYRLKVYFIKANNKLKKKISVELKGNAYFPRTSLKSGNYKISLKACRTRKKCVSEEGYFSITN